jgi:ATP-dependent RNA helicase DDX56/DBP9
VRKALWLAVNAAELSNDSCANGDIGYCPLPAAFAKVLDKRILKALGEMGFARPTLVQTQAIPIALEGRDILARARTGSGKTAAYCIPVVQKILQAKSVSA